MNTAPAGIDKHRLAGLQDGVYSIALTLLVLELKLPPLHGGFSDAQLWASLLELWPKVLTWMLSFWVLSVFWLGDVRAAAAATAVDHRVLMLALWKLALVSLLPFSTALMGEHGSRAPASALYAGHIAALSLLQFARAVHLRRSRALVNWTDEDARRAVVKSALILACALLALGLAFVAPAYNMLAMLPAAFIDAALRIGRGDAAAS